MDAKLCPAKNARRTQKESGSINEQLMGLVAAFGTLQTREPADPAVQAQVKKLQDFITENYYTCTKPILYQLGQMYGAGGEFTENINQQRLSREQLAMLEKALDEAEGNYQFVFLQNIKNKNHVDSLEKNNKELENLVCELKKQLKETESGLKNTRTQSKNKSDNPFERMSIW